MLKRCEFLLRGAGVIAAAVTWCGVEAA